MDEIVDFIKRKIILAVQCKDFGHSIDGEFSTTPAKIELLELACGNAARAALSALREAGYSVVPNEPTDDMIVECGMTQAAEMWVDADDCYRQQYRAMLRASPIKMEE